MFHTVLVATDGSKAASRAVDAAIDISLKYGSRLYIIHVLQHGRAVEELERMAEIEGLVAGISEPEPPAPTPEAAAVRTVLLESQHDGRVLSKIGEMILQRAAQRAREAGLGKVETLSANGDYADGILDAIDETSADLVVMGRRGLGKVRQLLLGSVSNKVVQQSGAAVLLIH